MSVFDITAQCLFNDGKGNIYLCPRYRRDEAERYFAHMRKCAADSVFSMLQFPSFITLVEDLDKLHFYRACIDQDFEPFPSIAAALSKANVSIDPILSFTNMGTNMVIERLFSVNKTERIL
jgi:hypothetical protein